MSSSLPGMVPRVSARRRPLVAAALLGLAVLAAASFGRDVVLRRRAASLLSNLGLGARPEVVGSLAACDMGDFAAAFAADAALAELAPGATPSGASGRYEARGKSGLASARDLAMVAAGERPGWSPHRLLLARAGYAVWDLEPRPDAGATGGWMAAFQAAGLGAPGLDLVWASAADACIAAWPRLSPREREDAIPMLRSAFLSAGYVRQAFPGAWRALGPRAAELLPDSAGSLKAGAAALRAMGEAGVAGALEQRGAKLQAGAGD